MVVVLLSFLDFFSFFIGFLLLELLRSQIERMEAAPGLPAAHFEAN